MDNKRNKRNRAQKTCSPCRRRKVKCDRGAPCSACILIGSEGKCVYTTTTTQALSDAVNNNNKRRQYKSVTSPISDREINISFLDKKSLDYKRLYVEEFTTSTGIKIKKCHSPLSSQAIFENNADFKKFTKIAESFIGIDIQEENFKNAQKINSNGLHHLNVEYTNMDIIQMVEKSFLLQCHGFKERVSYFEKDLSNLFYGFLPTEKLKQKFDEWFILKKTPVDNCITNSTNENELNLDFMFEETYVFRPPTDKCEFAILSYMIALNRVVNIFTVYLPNNTFKFNYNENPAEIHKLCLAVLAYSDYQNQPTFYSLATIMTIRCNSFFLNISNNLKSYEVDSYHLLQVTMEIGFSLGIHRRWDLFLDEGVTEKASQSLWNIMQLLDASFSTIFLRKPLIDYRYCLHSGIVEVEEQVTFYRSLYDQFSDITPISINDMISTVNNITSFISKLCGFKDLIDCNINGPKQQKHLLDFHTKCLLLLSCQQILFKIRFTLEEYKNHIDSLPVDEIKNIEEIKKRCEYQLLLSLLLSFKIIKECVANSFLKPTSGFSHTMLTLRFNLSKFVSMAYYFIVSKISVFDINCLVDKKPNNNSFSSYKYNMELELISLENLETIFSLPFDELCYDPSKQLPPKNMADHEIQKTSEIIYGFKDNFTAVIDLFLDLCNLGSTYKILTDSVILSSQFRFFIGLCNLLKTNGEMKKNWTKEHPGQAWKIDSEKWKILAGETKNKLNSIEEIKIDKSNENIDIQNNFESLDSDPWGFLENVITDDFNKDILESFGLDFGSVEADFTL
ncbi:hypothetical protein DAMA08_040160 [Martiniozyma asiatica (nom. inval.)]|nr:hypothetical protein DAMA08_040160 [Martiniozyma asiatica]